MSRCHSQRLPRTSRTRLATVFTVGGLCSCIWCCSVKYRTAAEGGMAAGRRRRSAPTLPPPAVRRTVRLRRLTIVSDCLRVRRGSRSQQIYIVCQRCDLV